MPVSGIAIPMPLVWDDARTPMRTGGAMIAAPACLLTLVTFLVTTEPTWHWFVLPVLLCGALIGGDGVDWLRGKLDIFDPAGVVGVLGLHIFFLAPLLHVTWDYWLPYVTPPGDWRGWLGGMAALNVAGIALYLIARKATTRLLDTQPHRTAWRLDGAPFVPVLAVALLATAALQAAVYAAYGGISGYVASFEEGTESFDGRGWLFMLSESFPILAFFGYAVATRARGKLPSWWSIGAAMTAFLVLKLLFGGLRGSRSNTIWGLFWAAGVVHLWLRPLSRRMVAGGVAFMILFMYVYGFYKNYGLGAVEALQGAETRLEMAKQSNRTLDAQILGDLGRADVQAYLLYRLTDPTSGSDYEYSWGETYLASVTLIIPKALWPGRPEGKVRNGTEILYGRTTAALGTMRASQVYGLAGEAMLNFGPAAAPTAYLVLGVVVALVGSWARTWDRADSRRLLLPLLINLAFIVLVSDSDNVLFVSIKEGAVPFLVIALSSRRLPVRVDASLEVVA